MCCDNTCINPMLPLFARCTFGITEHAAEARKIDKHEAGCGLPRSAIPFAPPTPKVREVLAGEINAAPNPDAEWLRVMAQKCLVSGAAIHLARKKL